MLLTLVLDPLRRPIGGPYPNGGEASLQSALGSKPPTHFPPPGIGQYVFGRRRQDIRDVPLAGTPSTGNRKDELHLRRIHFLTPRDADCPSQPTGRETLAERRTEAVTGIRQHTAEANAGCDHAINLSQRNLRLGPRCTMLDWNAGTLQTLRIARPARGNVEPLCHHHRHFTPRKRQRHQRLAIGCLAQR